MPLVVFFVPLHNEAQHPALIKLPPLWLPHLFLTEQQGRSESPPTPAEASSFQNCGQLAGRKPDLDSVGSDHLQRF